MIESILWTAVVVLFILAGIWREQNKKYRAELLEQENRQTLLYEEIYIADRLTDFIKQLKLVNKAQKPESLRLDDIISDLEQSCEIVERPRFQYNSRELIVLKEANTINELEQMSKKLQSSKKV
jgi:hypothetical protein